jgi:hypothetical protein
MIMDWLKYFSRKWLFKMVHHVGIKKTVRSDERNISRVCILHSIPSIAHSWHSDTSMLSEHKATIVQMPWKIVVPEVVFKYIYGGYVSFKNDEKPANEKHSWSYINAVESAHCIKDDDCILTTMTQHSKKDKVSPSFSNTVAQQQLSQSLVPYGLVTETTESIESVTGTTWTSDWNYRVNWVSHWYHMD